MDPSSRAHPYCEVQKGVNVTPFHIDFAGRSYILLHSYFKRCNDRTHKKIRESKKFTVKVTVADKIKAIIKVMQLEFCKVVVCAPGGTVVFRAGDYHAVITVYPEETPLIEQYALLCGKKK